MLNNFREKFYPVLKKIGIIFSSTGMSSNFWTLIGFIFSIVSAFFYSLSGYLDSSYSIFFPIFGSIFLLVSGFFDIVDGAVARVTNRLSKSGAFLDSIFDKISEVVVIFGIALGSLANPILCLLAISLSLLVSYSRSRSESLGVNLSGIGIGERAERIFLLGIIGLIPIHNSVEIAIILIILITAITLVQRIKVTLKKLDTI